MCKSPCVVVTALVEEETVQIDREQQIPVGQDPRSVASKERQAGGQ